MRTLRGVLSGALALIALQVAVQAAPASRLASLLSLPAKTARRFLDPTIPAIPDRRPQGESAEGAETTPPSRRYPDPFTPVRPAMPAEPGG